MKISELKGKELTVVEASSYRILVEDTTQGFPSNKFFLIQSAVEESPDPRLSVTELAYKEMT